MPLAAAYARVSTASGEQLSALDGQLRYLKDQGCDPILRDVESGLNIDRPAYAELKGLITANRVATLHATRADRLGRDAIEMIRLVRLCDQHGVRVLTRDDGTLSGQQSEQLMLLFIRAAMAEGESMKISQRVTAGFREGRKAGRPMRKPCWGYRLTADRSALEPDPEAFPRALRFIEQLRANGWRMQPTLEAFTEPIPLSSCRAVRSWMLNPTIRGGIGYHQQKNHRFSEILWDRHQPLLSHSDFAEFEAVVQHNRRMWGHNAITRSRLLTSLCVCAECGARLKYIPARTIASLRCNGDRCSQRYKGTREADIAEFAIAAIAREAAATLAAAAEHRESPEAMELRQQIAALEALNDPDLAGALEAKRQRLAAVSAAPAIDPALTEKLADPRWYSLATQEELRLIFQRLVAEIQIARQEPAAIRLRL